MPAVPDTRGSSLRCNGAPAVPAGARRRAREQHRAPGPRPSSSRAVNRRGCRCVLSRRRVLIGIDASRAVLARRTGTERYAVEIIRALTVAESDDRFVLYFNQPPEAGLLPRSDRVRWRIMPSRRLWTVGRLAAEMTVRPPDVLFVPAHSLPPILPRASVVTIHD